MQVGPRLFFAEAYMEFDDLQFEYKLMFLSYHMPLQKAMELNLINAFFKNYRQSLWFLIDQISQKTYSMDQCNSENQETQQEQKGKIMKSF